MLRVAWLLGKHKKPFTDGGVAQECMSAVAETLLEENNNSLWYRYRCQDHQTSKIGNFAHDVLTQLDEAMLKSPCVGLAVDESTDMCDNALLLVYVRFFNTDQKAFCEDLLGVTPLKTSTRGEDIYMAIKEMLAKKGI